jgi:16S rRNA processing protein RimM
MTRRNNVTPQENATLTGSPLPGEPVYLLVGKFRRPHGVRGEIAMEVLTDFPERLRKGVTIYVGEDHRPLRITSIRDHGKLLLLGFNEFPDCDLVGELRNCFVYVPTSSIPRLPEGEYYYHEIIGLRAVNESGELLGVLEEILETGANDVFVIKPEQGNEILLPVIEGVVINFDLQKGVITVKPPEWS